MPDIVNVTKSITNSVNKKFKGYGATSPIRDGNLIAPKALPGYLLTD